MFTFIHHILPNRQFGRYLVCCMLLLLNSFLLKAQVYPVQVNTIIIPPYSPYTNDYVSSANDKMIVNLLLRDINASNVQVKLRVNIEGQGVKLSTNPQANVPILTLDGGVPERLTGTDLEPYFRAENLVFAGLDANTYRQQGGKLPEGLYRICFDVYELKTGAKLSIASGCANAWMVLNDPPIINFPENNAKVAVRDPQYITFQWTPRHKGSPNSAFSTEYELDLVELMPGFTNNPQAGFLAGTPLYSTTTMNTMLVYGPGEPLLESGRTYAFRVKAKSVSAAQELDLFKNNGYSEIFSFIYQGTCAMPLNPDAQPKGATRAEITWTQGTPEQQEYVISYRKANTPDAAWFEEKTNTNDFMLVDLTPSTTYEYKVRCNCADGGVSTFTDVKTVTTPKDELADAAYNCGVIPPEVSITNQDPLPQLKARDMFMAGDFPVKILEVQGSNGTFSGKGYIGVPYLKNGQLGVAFTNISINTDYRMTKGQVITQYDASWKNIKDLDGYFEGGGNNGSVVTGNGGADVVVDVTINKPEDIKYTPATGTNSNGQPVTGGTLIITGSNGETVTKTVDKVPVTIKDADGNIYKVDEKGQVTQVARGNAASALPPSGELNTLHPDQGTVIFSAHANAKLAFDAWDDVYAKSSIFSREYQTLSDNYHVPAKLMMPGTSDPVTATITLPANSPIKPADIRFITGTGTEFIGDSISENTYAVMIVGGPANDAQELYAIYKPASGASITLGKLLIPSYAQGQRKLVLVPVNGASVTATDISNTLNKIYDPIGVHWDVTVDEPFTDMSWDNGDGVMNVEGSGLFSTLTSEMSALNDAYTQARNPNAQTTYLFVLKDGAGKDKAVAGDMPRDKQFGYLFTSGSNDLGVTAAHELGHGVCNLKHTFDDYGFDDGDLADNVMNYNGGTSFTKFQWGAVHDPAVVWGIFQGDGDAQQAIVNNMEVLAPFRNNDGSYTFLSMAGKPITLKGNLTQVSFVTSEDHWKLADGTPPLGALAGFKLDDKKYDAGKSPDNPQFLGYVDQNTRLFEEPYSAQKAYKYVLVGIPCLKQSKPVFKIFPTDYLDKNILKKVVTANNRGEGTIEVEDFLDGYLTREGEAKEVYADMATFSPQQLFFLGEHANDGSICGAEALYAFRAAYLIGKNPVLLNCLGDGGGLPPIAPVPTNGPIRDETALQEAYVAKYNEPNNKAFWQRVAALLTIYNGILESKTPEFEHLANDDINDVVKILDVKNARGRGCLLSTIPFKLRLQLLEKYQYWTEDTRKETLLADLIETTPESDEAALIAAMTANNYSLFWGLYNDINGSISDQFMTALSKIVRKNDVAGLAGLEQWPEYAAGEPEYLNVPYLRIAQPGSVNDGDNHVVSFGTSVAREGDDIHIIYSTKRQNVDVLQEHSETTREYTTNPFGLVRVRFRSDFEFPSLNGDEDIKSGTDIVVPAVWVYWLFDREKTKENYEAVDNLVKIATMVITAGTAATAEAGIKIVVDGVKGMVISAIKESVVASANQEMKDFVELWDQLDGIKSEIVAAQTVLNSVNKAVTKFTFKGAPADIAKAVRSLKDPKTLNDAADNIEKINELVDEVSEVFEDGTAVSVAKAMLVRAELGLKVGAYETDFEIGVDMFVDQDGQLIVSRENNKTSIGHVSGDRTSKKIGLSELRWYHIAALGGVQKVLGHLNDISYVNEAGQVTTGDLEIVTAAGDQPYVMEACLDPVALVTELNIKMDLAIKLSTCNVFCELYKAKTRLIQVIIGGMPNQPVTLRGTRTFDNYKVALLTTLVEVPQTMKALDEDINAALKIYNNGQLDIKAYEDIAKYEAPVNKMLGDLGFNRDFDAAAVFNTALYDSKGLTTDAMRALKDARTKYEYSASKNAIVATFNTSNAGPQERVAYSGGKTTRPGTCPFPDPLKLRLGQFNHPEGVIRWKDSESKFLEELWDDLKNQKYLGVTEITIISERPVCPSCTKAIAVFEQEFNIKINIFEGKYKWY